jgi:hypothetical protein
MMLLEIWIRTWEEPIAIFIGLKISKISKNKDKAKIRLITKTTSDRVIRKLSNINNIPTQIAHVILKMGLKQKMKMEL